MRTRRRPAAPASPQVALQALPIPVGLLDQQGRLVFRNQAWTELAQETDHPFLNATRPGGHYLKACRRAANHDEETLEQALAGIQAVLDGAKASFSCDFSLISFRREEERWFTLMATPLPGRRRSGVLLWHADITERKRAEDAFRRARVETGRARARLRDLYQSLPIGLLILNRDLVVESLTPPFAELTGHPVEAHLGRHLSDLFPPARWAKLRPVCEQVLATGEPSRSLEEEVSDVRVPGRTRFLRWEFFPDRQSDGSIRGVLAVVQDQTEHKHTLRAQAQQLRELEARNRELDQMAIRDPLTGLYNRRFFDEAVSREWGRFQRSGEGFTVMIMDIDAFKLINDRYGHEAGDLALQQVGVVLRSSLRESDLVARVGGDEFAVLLPRTEGERSRPVVEKLERALRHVPVTTPAGTIPVHLSLGAATVPGAPPIHSAAELLRVADKRMYEAKRRGLAGEPDLH